MKANIKLSLYKLKPVLLLALLRNVVAKMTGNANFATPAVPVADLTALGNAYEAAIEAATFGSRQSKLQRNALTAQVRDQLRKQADYVRSVANGDKAVLESSGFELMRQPEPIGVPGIAKDMQARMTGLKGEVELRWRSVAGAHGYQVWMTDKDPAASSSWQPIGYTTRVSHRITALESYKAYWFCVNAIGSAGAGAQSDPALGRAA